MEGGDFGLETDRLWRTVVDVCDGVVAGILLFSTLAAHCIYGYISFLQQILLSRPWWIGQDWFPWLE
jgi:hypothetical protein